MADAIANDNNGLGAGAAVEASSSIIERSHSQCHQRKRGFQFNYFYLFISPIKASEVGAFYSIGLTHNKQ